MKHIEILYYENNRECYLCGKYKFCIILHNLGDDTMVLCKNCLKKMINKLEKKIDEVKNFYL
jgi:hypothetical protein